MKPGSRPQYYRIRRMVQMVREGAETGYLDDQTGSMKLIREVRFDTLFHADDTVVVRTDVTKTLLKRRN